MIAKGERKGRIEGEREGRIEGELIGERRGKVACARTHILVARHLVLLPDLINNLPFSPRGKTANNRHLLIRSPIENPPISICPRIDHYIL